MADLRDEIPLRATINALIIDCAINKDAFKRCTRATLKKLGYDPGMAYPYKNQAYVVSFLYCLVVVPREIWLQAESHRVYQTIQGHGLTKLFETHPEQKVFDFMRHLRNAISHANFSIDHSQAFEFWDNRRDGSRIWVARISNPNLMSFISQLAPVVWGLGYGQLDNTHPLGTR